MPFRGIKNRPALYSLDEAATDTMVCEQAAEMPGIIETHFKSNF